MSSNLINIIEKEIRKRIWDLCKEYGDAFDVNIDKSNGSYSISIVCNFPGVQKGEIVCIRASSPTSIREFNPAERDQIKRIGYQVQVVNRYITSSYAAPLDDLRKEYFLDSSVHDRLTKKGYRVDINRFKAIEKELNKIRNITRIFYLAERITVTYLANAIMLEEKYKLGDIVKKRVLERALGLYCYIVEFIASKRRIKVSEISDICRQTKSHIKKQDFDMLTLDREDFDDFLDMISFRAEIRWREDRMKRWVRPA